MLIELNLPCEYCFRPWLVFKVLYVNVRMMGNWEEAFKDLTLALKLDWDPDTNATLKEVEEKVPYQ